MVNPMAGLVNDFQELISDFKTDPFFAGTGPDDLGALYTLEYTVSTPGGFDPATGPTPGTETTYTTEAFEISLTERSERTGTKQFQDVRHQDRAVFVQVEDTFPQPIIDQIVTFDNQQYLVREILDAATLRIGYKLLLRKP